MGACDFAKIWIFSFQALEANENVNAIAHIIPNAKVKLWNLHNLADQEKGNKRKIPPPLLRKKKKKQ